MIADEYQKLVNHLPTAHYNPRVAYEMSHNPSYYHSEWVQYFKEEQPSVYHSYMTNDEQKLYDALPDTLRVYRGIATEKNNIIEEYGLSWTLDKDVALFFADKYARRINKHLAPIILEQTINKQDIVWVLLEREEKEVVVLPKELRQ